MTYSSFLHNGGILEQTLSKRDIDNNFLKCHNAV